MNLRKLVSGILLGASLVAVLAWFQQQNMRSELRAQQAQSQSATVQHLASQEEIKRLKGQIQALETKSHNDLREITRLRAVIKAAEETERLNSRLKSERDTLEREVASSRRIPDNETPEWKPAQARMRFAKILGLAIRQHAASNEGEAPADLDAAINGLEQGKWEEWIIEHVSASAAALNISEDQFEITFRGRFDSLQTRDPGTVMIAREKSPVQLSNSRWARACVFEDAHSELLVADTMEDLEAKELKYLVLPKQ